MPPVPRDRARAATRAYASPCNHLDGRGQVVAPSQAPRKLQLGRPDRRRRGRGETDYGGRSYRMPARVHTQPRHARGLGHPAVGELAETGLGTARVRSSTTRRAGNSRITSSTSRSRTNGLYAPSGGADSGLRAQRSRHAPRCRAPATPRLVARACTPGRGDGPRYSNSRRRQRCPGTLTIRASLAHCAL